MPSGYPAQIAVLADFTQLFAKHGGKVYYSDKILVIKTIMKNFIKVLSINKNIS
jgi:hypothetical protein